MFLSTLISPNPDPCVRRGTRPQELCFEPDPPSPAPFPPPVCSHPTYRKERAPCSPKFVLFHCPAPFCARGWDRDGHRGPHTSPSSHGTVTQKGLSSSFFLTYSLRHPPFLSTCAMTNVTQHPSRILNINPLNPMWEPAGERLPIRTASYMDRNSCTRPSIYKTKDTSKPTAPLQPGTQIKLNPKGQTPKASPEQGEPSVFHLGWRMATDDALG